MSWRQLQVATRCGMKFVFDEVNESAVARHANR
jgi:hypothetical protein